MRIALKLAERGTGCTSPNPLVGCVIVRDNKVIGEGWHEVYGHAHAEVNALRSALQNDVDVNSQSETKVLSTSNGLNDGVPQPPLKGCTLYVTLEPCNHHGLTPPCTQAILDAGISTVVYALDDPNPKAAGGAGFLRDNAINVIGGVLEAEARFQNRFFLKHVQCKQPFVIAKSASSLDGRIATRSGHSQWITGPEARIRGHELRQQVDAILIGANTVLSDNPALTVRLPEQQIEASSIRHPRPVILDTQGRVPLNTQLLGNAALPTRSIVATSNLMDTSHRHELESRGIEVITLPLNEHGIGIDPESLLNALGQRGIQSVLLEGGAALHGSFRDARLIDEIWAFIAPTVIGGADAHPSYTGTGSHKLDDATQLHHVQVETLGRDVLLRGLVVTDDEHQSNAARQMRNGESQRDANIPPGNLDASASQP